MDHVIITIPMIPFSIDLANTATVRIGLKINDACGGTPTAGQITAGSLAISRKAKGSTLWEVIFNSGCNKTDGQVYVSEIFDYDTGYRWGDSIRLVFYNQKVTIDGVDYVISTSASQLWFQTEIREIIQNVIWDEVLTGASHNNPTSAGRRLRDVSSSVIITGTSPNSGGTANTAVRIELDNDASSGDGAYDPAVINIVNGTGAGQSRQAYEYDGPNKLLYVNRDWKVIPDDTSEYVITSNAGNTHVNEGVSMGGSGPLTFVLNKLASTDDDIYNGQLIFISAGTGQDQARIISDYDGPNQTAIIDVEWDITPDDTSVYAMLPVQPAKDIVDIKEDTTFIRDMEGGGREIDPDTFQEIRTKSDNTIEVAKFDLKDINGEPTTRNIFKKLRNLI